MRFLCYMLSMAMLIFPAHAEHSKTSKSTVPNDQLIFAEQFVRLFFPQVGGRDAVIDIQVEVPASTSADYSGHYSEPWAHRLAISVIDWCTPPRDPTVPHIGGTTGRPGMPCTHYDKQYKRPLWGEIGFANQNGRMVPVDAFFDGKLFDDAPPCYKEKPGTPQELIERLHLDRLAVLFRKKMAITKVSQEDDADWTVLIQVGPPGSRHSLYAFYFDECGSVRRFSLEN